MTTARQVAADVLHRSRSRDAFAAELIDDAVSAATITPQDRRFVTQLVFGVIRRKGTLDALLKPFIQIPMHAVAAARLGRAAPRRVPARVPHARPEARGRERDGRTRDARRQPEGEGVRQRRACAASRNS